VGQFVLKQKNKIQRKRENKGSRRTKQRKKTERDKDIREGNIS
jgi:hypothetical protein